MRVHTADAQALPSSHAVPFGLAGFEHVPVAGLQVPGSWHWSGARQTTGTPATQLPATHASPTVQASPSSHGVASAAAGFEQSPVDGSHVPASWHWSRCAQTTATPGTQPPATHASPTVHASPSSQGVASATGAYEQSPVAGSQIPASWH